ncbi:MAG: T9SS type A sorting domain-containing protein [Bacteroidia bacterium]
MKQFLLSVLFLFSFLSNSFAQVFWEDNFDTTTVQWVATSNNPNGSNWELGTPNFGVTNSTHSGINSWDISLDSAYKPNSESVLTGPVFDFSSLSTSLRFFFWGNQNSQIDSDGFRIECSVNGGPWNVLGNIADPLGDNWYNSISIGNTGKPGWTGNSGGWTKRSYSLAQYANSGMFQLRLVFTSDSTIENDGISIDDFGIELAPVTITFADDSVATPCQVPQTVKLECHGNINTGVIGTDSVLMHILFGDGTDTIFQQSTDSFYDFHAVVYHTYNLPGSFTVAYIATNSIGDVDTLIRPSQIVLSNSCGNISGIVYSDFNNNCIYDGGDSLWNCKAIQLTDTVNNYSCFTHTDTVGYYSFNAPQGYVYNVTYSSPLYFGTVCPGLSYTGISTFPSANNDFAIGCAPGFDLQCFITSTNYRPGANQHLSVWASNLLCQTINANVKLLLDSDLTFIGSYPSPNLISGDTLIWNFNPVSYQYGFMANIIVNTDTQAVLGNYLYNTCIIEPIAGDANSSNNTFTSSGLVTNSLDPNEKTVNPIGNISANQTLTYTINFQNTGNDVAYNIFILDTLDAGLDASTFIPIASSDTVQTEILNGNVLHFMFNNIQLPDSGSNEPASHGFVTYTIKPLSTLTPGTLIKNTSYIYFDFNSPVITNTTSNTISLIASNNDIAKTENNLIVYPNPANNNIVFKLKDSHQKITAIKITNALGQIMFNEKKSSNFLNIALNNWNQGLYFYQIISDKHEYFSGTFAVSK